MDDDLPNPNDADEEMRELLENTEVEVGDDSLSLVGIVKDIETAHQELDDYKKGALILASALKERQEEAENNGNEQLVEVLEDFHDSSFGVYLRLQRGDLELVGERDGKHSGYFSDD